MLWKILFFMILLRSLVNLFHFNMYILLYPDVVSDYICKVLRRNEPVVSWQMVQPILFFISHINVTDVCVTVPDVIRLYYLCYMVHNVIMKPCGYQRVTRSLCCGLLFEFQFW